MCVYESFIPYLTLLLKYQKSFRFELPRKYEGKYFILNSRFKTKEVQYRRAQILELKAQGHNQEEIAKIMNVTPTLIRKNINDILIFNDVCNQYTELQVKTEVVVIYHEFNGW